MMVCLSHEIAHCLGMDDVYDNPGHDKEGTRCVMEKYNAGSAIGFYSAVEEGRKFPFCDSCMDEMQEYTSNIVISGN